MITPSCSQLLVTPSCSQVRVLSDVSVAEMASSSVDGRLLEPPFGYQGGVSDDVLTRLVHSSPAFARPDTEQFLCRQFNFWPGQTVGLGMLLVDDAPRASLVPSAHGFAWWCGSASTFFGFNPLRNVGVVLMGHQIPALPEARHTAWRDAINAAHANLLTKELTSASDISRARATSSDVWWEAKLNGEQERRTSETEHAAQAERDAELQAEREARKLASDAAAADRAERRLAPLSGSEASSTEASPRKPKHMTTAQLKKLLREAGVDVPEGATRPELEALLERV